MQSLGPTDPVTVVSEEPSVESTLCRLFAETLGVASFDVHDDFFARGGHSMTAVTLVNRINAELDIEVDVWLLFEFSTVAALTGELGL